MEIFSVTTKIQQNQNKTTKQNDYLPLPPVCSGCTVCNFHYSDQALWRVSWPSCLTGTYKAYWSLLYSTTFLLLSKNVPNSSFPPFHQWFLSFSHLPSAANSKLLSQSSLCSEKSPPCRSASEVLHHELSKLLGLWLHYWILPSLINNHLLLGCHLPWFPPSS